MTELNAIPVPQFPLGELGKFAYDKMTKALFDAGKLTAKNLEACDKFALLSDRIGEKIKSGEVVTVADIVTRINALKAEVGE